MSKERELLKKLLDAITELDYRQGLDPLTCEIEELLAEPEQEPDYYLWYDEVHEEHPTNEGDPDVYPLYLSAQKESEQEPIDAFKAVQEFEGNYIYKDGFIDGIKYATSYYGIGVDNE